MGLFWFEEEYLRKYRKYHSCSALYCTILYCTVLYIVLHFTELTLEGVVLVSPQPGDVSRPILLPLLPPEEEVLGGHPVPLPQRALVPRGGEEGEVDGELLHLPEVPRQEGDVGLAQICSTCW